MAISTKTIKRRIKSIGNTKKITKAMEMISAVKMRRAVASATQSRNYSSSAWEMVLDIIKKTSAKRHPLLMKRDIKKVALLIITSNRGLAGGFSSKLLTEAHKQIKNIEDFKHAQVDVIVMGKRGRKIYQNFGHTIALEFDKADLMPSIEKVLPLSKILSEDFINGKYDALTVAYTQYFSAIKQLPVVKQILPISTKEEVLIEPAQVLEVKPEKKVKTRFLFEPGAAQVLEKLLPRIIEVQLYQAILESDASEHSARMMAMRNATDAAKDMIKDLNTTFNNARQANITKEISEIVGGAAALE